VLRAVATSILALAVAIGCASSLSTPGVGLTPEVSNRWGCDYGSVASRAEIHRQDLIDANDYYVPTVGWDACDLLAHNGAPSRVEERAGSVDWWYESATTAFKVTLQREESRYSDTAVWVVRESSAATTRDVEPVTHVTGPGGRVQEVRPTETVASADYVEASLEEVWTALLAAYKAMGIPGDVLDSRNMTVGNRGFRAERIDGSRLSRFVDSGSGARGSPSADSYHVTMSVVTRVSEQDTERVLLETEVSATADPRDRRGGVVRCTTTGVLEDRIVTLVKAALTSAVI